MNERQDAAPSNPPGTRARARDAVFRRDISYPVSRRLPGEERHTLTSRSPGQASDKLWFIAAEAVPGARESLSHHCSRRGGPRVQDARLLIMHVSHDQVFPFFSPPFFFSFSSIPAANLTSAVLDGGSISLNRLDRFQHCARFTRLRTACDRFAGPREWGTEVMLTLNLLD